MIVNFAARNWMSISSICNVYDIVCCLILSDLLLFFENSSKDCPIMKDRHNKYEYSGLFSKLDIRKDDFWYILLESLQVTIMSTRVSLCPPHFLQASVGLQYILLIL